MTTHWSVVGDFSLQKVGPDRAHAALTRLCQDYWPPLYRFVRLRGYSRADAQDLTQGFFAYLCEKRSHTVPDRNKGRFRTFLLVLLKRYLRAAEAHQCRQKRGGGQFPLFLDAEINEFHEIYDNALVTAAPADEEQLFERNWAASLVTRSMDALYCSGVGAVAS
jgi:RNA polymerase sigma-70 factor (ECF subfamily)